MGRVMGVAEKYKSAKMARVFVVMFLSISWWISLSNHGIEEFLASVIAFGGLEYLSLNVLFERNFYPANQYVDRVFPDKQSFGNKFLYYLHYFVYVFFVVYAFFVDIPS